MPQKRIQLTNMIRLILLGLCLVLIMVLHYLHATVGVQYPSVHAVCPLGGIENLWAWMAGRANIQKIFSGTMSLFFFTLVFAFLFRRGFCGNVCPFGALQELLGKFFPKKFRIPQKVDKFLLLIKYAVLILSVVMAWVTVSLWIAPYDPWAAFAHLSSGSELFVEFPIGTLILFLVVVSSLFLKRPFCKYLCPAGALYAGAGKFSPLKAVRNPSQCINCGKCTKECPMDIEVDKLTVVTSAECIGCARCVDVCPGAGSMIAMKMAGKKVTPLAVVLAAISLFLGGLLLLDAVGLYQVSLPPAAEIIQNKSYIRISDLRGSMTIEQGAFYTGKPLEEFYRVMEIPLNIPPDIQLKSVAFYVPDYDFHVIKAGKGSE